MTTPEQPDPYGGQHNPYGGQQPPAGQPYYGPPPGMPPYGYGRPILPKHPSSTTALVLGLVAVAGGFVCLLPLLCAPFAWIVGHRALKDMREMPHTWSGEGEAKAGFILGIIGTVLLFLAIVAVILVVVLVATTSDTTYYNDGSTFDTMPSLVAP
ncbi:MAG: hypothetical protein JWP10_1421 [Nocardioidaceae bacterium]|nr:hypothetical protein [Nocardioidaceae bacterium]